MSLVFISYMDKKFFEEFNTVDAGMTLKPDESLSRRLDMVGKYDLVVKANLVHGTDICIIDKDALKDGPYIEIEDCDGLVTDLKNVVLSITTGDCIPIFVYDEIKHVIGIAHSGWKGTADCIASALIYWMQEEYKCNPTHIHALIGPGIGACCFEVDLDVVDYFTESMPWTEEYMYQRYDGKYMIDLKAIIAEVLEIEGLLPYNIEIDNECTCCIENRDRFWTYRGAKDSNRMLSYISQK